MTGEHDSVLVDGVTHLSVTESEVGTPTTLTTASSTTNKEEDDVSAEATVGLVAKMGVPLDAVAVPRIYLHESEDEENDIDELLEDKTEYDESNIIDGDDDSVYNEDFDGSDSHSDSDVDVDDTTNGEDINDSEVATDEMEAWNNREISDSMDSDLISESEDDASKVFGFSLPFNGATDFMDDINIFKNSQFLQKHFHKDEPRLITKKFSELSKVFRSKQKPALIIPKPIVIKRPYHAKSPYPPPGTKVYWDDIASSDLLRDLEVKEEVLLKLERQESIDTLTEAVYYRDISKLNDGKLKALGKSLLPEKSIKNLNTKISAIKIKRDGSSTTLNMHSTIEQPGSSSSSISKVFRDSSSSPSLVPVASPLSVKSANSASLSNIISSPQAPSLPEQIPPLETTSSLAELKLSASKMFASASNCSTSLFSKELDVFDKLDGDVIVLGGYRGSTLRSVKSKRRLWIPNIRDGVGIVKKNSLRLGHRDEDELRELNAREFVIHKKIKKLKDKANRPKVYPDGMLTHVGPVDISRKLLKKLNSNPRVVARDWGYDWRLSVHHTAKQLHDYISDIVSQQKEKKGVILIAHSMGGIVAHGAMVLDPSLIRGIVYAGTPMPCCNILGPLRFTDAILLNKDLLSLENNFFMRSSFVFLPPSWNGDNGMSLFRDLADGHKYHIDYWNPVNWIIYNLNPMVSSIRLQNDIAHGTIKLSKIKDEEIRRELESVANIEIDPETKDIVNDEINRLSKPVTSFIDAYTYLRRTLSRTKKFLQSLERKENVNYPPLAQVFSNGVPSVKYSLVNGEETIKRGEYYRFFYGPGDGVVYQGWTFPRERGRHDPEEPVKYGYDDKYAFDLCGRFHASCGHIGLLAEVKLIGKALEAILEEESSRKEKHDESHA